MTPATDGVLPAADQRGRLAAEVATLEVLPRSDPDGAAERARRAVVAAQVLGAADLVARARLVLADVLERRGDVAGAGRIASEVNRWAAEHGESYVLARSHYVLEAVFADLGDSSGALEHAVRAVELLGDDGSPALRLDHLVRLADCTATSGDEAAALARYPEVLRLAEDLGDVDRQLLVLNNWAYTEALAGHYEVALQLCEQLQSVAARHGVALHLGRLDTVARALMGLGRHAEAELLLLPGLDPAMAASIPDGDALAACLLTLAEVQRVLGSPARAQQTLDAAVRLCDAHGLAGVRVQVREEQAQLHAAVGDHRAAYEEHRLFHAESVQLQSAQREARARALQALYETTEARRQSRQYRELSLRDPLTGLYNRRHVDDELPRLLRRQAAGAHGVLTVALVDLDHFKRVNDTWSHDVGDQVLQAVAGLLDVAAAGGQAGSFAARMGGEEFLLVLLTDDAGVATGQLEQLCRTVGGHPWAPLTGVVPVTVSIGATSVVGGATEATSVLLARADEHLYRAKRQGRDRVAVDA